MCAYWSKQGKTSIFSSCSHFNFQVITTFISYRLTITPFVAKVFVEFDMFWVKWAWVFLISNFHSWNFSFVAKNLHLHKITCRLNRFWALDWSKVIFVICLNFFEAKWHLELNLQRLICLFQHCRRKEDKGEEEHLKRC